MSAGALLSGTSAYRLQHRRHSPSPSPSPARPSSTQDNEHISLTDAIHDPDVWQHSPRRLQDHVEARIERLRLRTRRRHAQSEYQRTLDHETESDDEIDFDNCDYTAAAGVPAPTPPPFHVTITSEEEEDDEEESSNDDYPNVETMADRIQREGRWRPSSDDEDEHVVPRRLGTGARFRQLLESSQFADHDGMRSRRIAIGPRYRHLLDNTEPIRASRLSKPSRIDVGAHHGSGPVIAPHARFFIKKNRNKVTIKFEPAMYVQRSHLQATPLTRVVALVEMSCSSCGAQRIPKMATLISKAYSSTVTLVLAFSRLRRLAEVLYPDKPGFFFFEAMHISFISRRYESMIYDIAGHESYTLNCSYRRACVGRRPLHLLVILPLTLPTLASV